MVTAPKNTAIRAPSNTSLGEEVSEEKGVGGVCISAASAPKRW